MKRRDLRTAKHPRCHNSSLCDDEVGVLMPNENVTGPCCSSVFQGYDPSQYPLIFSDGWKIYLNSKKFTAWYITTL